jgi:hypothetical protein
MPPQEREEYRKLFPLNGKYQHRHGDYYIALTEVWRVESISDQIACQILITEADGRASTLYLRVLQRALGGPNHRDLLLRKINEWLDETERESGETLRLY